MSRRGVGAVLLATAAFLKGTHSLANAIYVSVPGRIVFPDFAPELGVLSWIVALAGIAYLAWAELRPEK